jgi:hypothetical protein
VINHKVIPQMTPLHPNKGLIKIKMKIKMSIIVKSESNDQGGDEDDGDNEEAPPHTRVHNNVQRDHPMNNILGDIEKGVTTRSHVANFCEHYPVVSSFKLFKVEDALYDPD